ncbi:hypothetical protein [Erythrobacter litoralis]|uniref:hypothetical protein n=1 Tax=Erythrobacter litoralis TaxID=39960 RepID=UPI00243590D0|nr:hypothetical protein [Erythrobacter litoralis]
MTPADAGFAALARALHAKAERLALAHGEALRRGREGYGPRDARLLWPLFSERTK